MKYTGGKHSKSITFKVYYYIIPGCLRTKTIIAESRKDAEKEFLTYIGVKKQNIFKIVKDNGAT